MTELPAWRLVTHKSPRWEHAEVRRMDRRIAETEWHTCLFGWRPNPDWEAWLCGEPAIAVMILAKGGYVTGTAWRRERGWVEPPWRRQGILTAGDKLAIARYKSISVHNAEGNVNNAWLSARGWKRAGGPFWTSPPDER